MPRSGKFKLLESLELVLVAANTCQNWREASGTALHKSMNIFRFIFHLEIWNQLFALWVNFLIKQTTNHKRNGTEAFTGRVTEKIMSTFCVN